MRGTPLPAAPTSPASLGNAVTNARRSRSRSSSSPASSSSALGWPKDWLELVVFVAAGVVCFASLGVAWSHVIPNFDAAPAYTNIVFLPVIFISRRLLRRRQRAGSSCATSPQALPLAHIIDGLSRRAGHRRRRSPTTVGDLAVIALWAVARDLLRRARLHAGTTSATEPRRRRANAARRLALDARPARSRSAPAAQSSRSIPKTLTSS